MRVTAIMLRQDAASLRRTGYGGNPLRALAIHFAPLLRYDRDPELPSWSVNRFREA